MRALIEICAHLDEIKIFKNKYFYKIKHLLSNIYIYICMDVYLSVCTFIIYDAKENRKHKIIKIYNDRRVDERLASRPIKSD